MSSRENGRTRPRSTNSAFRGPGRACRTNRGSRRRSSGFGDEPDSRTPSAKSCHEPTTAPSSTAPSRTPAPRPPGKEIHPLTANQSSSSREKVENRFSPAVGRTDRRAVVARRGDRPPLRGWRDRTFPAPHRARCCSPSAHSAGTLRLGQHLSRQARLDDVRIRFRRRTVDAHLMTVTPGHHPAPAATGGRARIRGPAERFPARTPR